MRKYKSAKYVVAGAALAVSAVAGSKAHAAELIYGFDDSTLNGFVGNSAKVAFNTSTGVVQGAGDMEIINTAGQTFGGADTMTVPSDFYNATSFNVSITITTTPMASGAPVYFDLVPNFYSSDGSINPDLGNTSSYINLGGLAPGTYTYDVNLDAYTDPDGVLPGDATPGEILIADQAYDLANGITPIDSITGFQLSVEHGGGTGTTLFVDNLTVPSASVPEPASLSVIGLGGLTLLGRRRRAALNG